MERLFGCLLVSELDIGVSACHYQDVRDSVKDSIFTPGRLEYMLCSPIEIDSKDQRNLKFDEKALQIMAIFPIAAILLNWPKIDFEM